MPAIATRAVICDMVGPTGQDPVKEGTAFNGKEIQVALKLYYGARTWKCERA